MIFLTMFIGMCAIIGIFAAIVYLAGLATFIFFKAAVWIIGISLLLFLLGRLFG